jgi:hypothetical protein
MISQRLFIPPFLNHLLSPAQLVGEKRGGQSVVQALNSLTSSCKIRERYKVKYHIAIYSPYYSFVTPGKEQSFSKYLTSIVIEASVLDFIMILKRSI